MHNLPLEAAYPTDEEIKIHLAAGRYYEKSSTCGNKIKWTTFERAHREAKRLTERYGNPKEAYPCYFCSPDIEKGEFLWHAGRVMEPWEWDLFAENAGEILEMEDVTLTGGQRARVHNRKFCEGRNCCVHNPSSHNMVNWNQNWRSDMQKMERICPHGIGHPDPDDVSFQKSIGRDVSVHGCDGCCARMGQ